MIRLSLPDIGDEECRAVERVLRSGNLVQGDECRLFEKELAAYLGTGEVVVVSSGTAALHLSLVALGIGRGEAVLVPDFTFPATANVVEMVGARPVMVDVDIATYNMTVENLERAMAAWSGPEKLRAIMPVHEFGCPADMTGIMELAERHGLLVIEDAACGIGAVHDGKSVGTFGRTGCFSFHPRKALTTGEGGAVATDDGELAALLRQWRSHGMHRSADGVRFLLPGFNYRLTDFQAAMGRVQLGKFPENLVRRRKLRDDYCRELAGSAAGLPEDVQGHSWQTFMVRLPAAVDRNGVIEGLRAAGIEANIGAQALHMQDYYAERYPGEARGLQGNNAEFLYGHGLALPMYARLESRQVAEIAGVLNRLLNGQNI